MNVKRLISILITVSMIAGMFVCVPVHADAVSKEVMNLTFEEGGVTPTFTYEDKNYTVLDNGSIKGYISKKNHIYGRTGDTCLYVNTSSVAANKNSEFTVPNISSLKDIGGGAIVVSWDMAAEALEGTNEFQHLITLSKKDTTTGEYSTQPMNFYYSATGMYLNYGSGHNNQNQNLTSYKPANGGWHRYDLVLYYGTAKLELYQDGIVIKSDDYGPRTLNKNKANGVEVITGLAGDTDNTLLFRLRNKETGNKKVYYDNIRIRKYIGTFSPDYYEDFSTASKNFVPTHKDPTKSDYLYKKDDAADFEVESGVYGKVATDQSIKIVKKNVGSGSKEVYYQHTGTGTGYQAGGTVHIGFSLAFDKIERIMNKFLQIDPSNSSDTREKIVELKYGKLVSMGNETPVNWETGKWYRFDVYVVPGNGSDVMNTVDVYMNGKKMFEDVPMKTSSLGRLNPLRIGQLEKVDIYNDVMYIDDFTYAYSPAGISVARPNVALSSNDEDIRVVDTDTIFIDGTKTAADVENAISVTGGTKYILSDSQTLAEGTENATDCYLLVSAANGGKHICPIVNRVDRYTEDFSSREYSGSAMKDWSAVNTPSGKTAGQKGGAYGLSGKASTDQSYKNINGYVGHEYKYQDAPLVIDNDVKATIEFSILMNDMAASENMAFMFEYEDANGEIKQSSLVTLLHLSKGKVQLLGVDSSTYSKNQWNKFAIEIDPKTFTADVYHNGKLAMENQRLMASSFDATDCEIVNIYRFKYEHSGNSTTDEYSAIDDFKVYLGSYNAGEDALACTSEDYIVKNNWIAITEETDTDTFDSTISLDNIKRKVIFDDETMESTEIADEYEMVCHNQIMAVETEGGAIHYYRIVDQNEKTTVISNNVFAGANASSLTEVKPGDKLELGTYRAKAVYEKYNNDPEYVYVALRSNLIDTPNDMEDVSFIKRELVFGLNDLESNTIEIEDTDEQLKAMIWNTDLSPFCEAFVTPLEKETPENKDDAYSTPSVPTEEEIEVALNSAHPRLMVTDFDALAQSIKTDADYKKWYYSNKGTANENQNSVEYRAQLYAGYDMPVYEDDDSERIVSASTFRDRVILFAFNHKITNRVYSKPSDYYKNKVWEYLNSAKDWPDWGHENEFLNTADMIMAYAIAYDWLYDEWTDEEKKIIRDTLKSKGLNYAQSIYNGNPNDYSSWIDRENNWTAWCNSPILLGALAIADEDEIGIPLVRNALDNISTCYGCFAPDGAWDEGTGYGEVAMSFLAIALSSCETALSSDFGHKYAEGLSDAGFYNMYMSGKNKSFGLNDSSGDNNLYFDFYFGKLFNDKYLSGLRYHQLQNLGANATVYDLIWYDKSNVSTRFLTDMPFDMNYSGIETSTMRAGGFLDNTTAFAGLHAGYNNVNHGHLDGGNFVYETNGVRWALDLGADSYNLHNYFETDSWAQLLGKSRWDYYRCRAEGHNTWVINPDSDADQKVEGKGTILKNSFTKDGTSWSIADLTDFYSDDASSAKRGIMLNKANGSLIVRDEISLKSSSTLYWFMHTNASISVSDDGKSAILTQDGRRLWVGIIDGDGTFAERSATPLPSSPNPDEWSENKSKAQNANDGINKLSIKYTGKSGTLDQTVYMVELEDGQSAPASIPQSTSLANWEE